MTPRARHAALTPLAVNPDEGIGTGGDGASTADNFDLGPALRRLRLRHGLKASELAARAGVSTSAVSQIEVGTILPSLVTLRRLASALNEPVFRLLVDAEGRQVVVRRRQRKHLGNPASEARYELVSPDLEGRFEVLWMWLQPGTRSAPEATRHKGEEFLLVFHGIAELTVAGDVHRLRVGDSATWSGDLPHMIRNPGRRELEAILVLSPPTF